MIRTTLAALLLTATPLCAQSAWTEPQIHETPQEFSTVGLFLGDSALDFAIIDRATGAVRIGEKLAAGGINWTTILTGIRDVSAAQAGALTPGGTDHIALTSLAWNRVEFITSDSILSSANSVGLDITALAPNTSNLEILLDTPLVSSSDIASVAYLSRFSKATGLLTSTAAAPPLRSGGTLRTGATQRHTAFIDEAAHELQVYSPALTKRGILTGLPPGALFTEIITRTTAGGPLNYGTAVWAPGATQFLHATFNTLGFFNAPVTITAPFALGQVRYIDAESAGTVVLLTSQDGSQAAKVMLPAGGTTLQALQSFTPPAGESFTGAQIIGDSRNIHLFSGTGGITASSQEYLYNSATGLHAAGTASTLPTLTGTRTTANLYTFTGEPWVNPATTFTKSFKSRDWTISATNAGGTIAVTALQDAGPASGVGSPSAQNISGSTAGHFAVPNQIRPDTSIATMGTSIGTPRPTLGFDPQPGIYQPLFKPDGTSYGLSIRIQNPSGLTSIRYRINGGTWQEYIDTNRPVLTATSTIEALGGSAGTDNASPTARGTYQIGSTGPLTSSLPADTNGNGLSDAWEKSFALTDPNGDPDGDGSNNLTEYNNGTDPRNPTSFSLGTLPELSIGPAPAGGYRVSWTSSDSTLILETSTEISSGWADISPASLNVSGDLRSYNITTLTVNSRRFYRLRRP